jgi:hypothetical protein
LMSRISLLQAPSHQHQKSGPVMVHGSAASASLSTANDG